MTVARLILWRRFWHVVALRERKQGHHPNNHTTRRAPVRNTQPPLRSLMFSLQNGRKWDSLQTSSFSHLPFSSLQEDRGDREPRFSDRLHNNIREPL